jgi:diaminopropionate ammonia-lyase
MAGLNCGLPSQLVWPLVLAGTDVFVAITDTYAEQAMQALAREGVVAGESGAAGLGGLLAVADLGDAGGRRAAGLLPDACVLVINTEGATDPGNYLAVVGRTASDVAAAAPAATGSAGLA